MEIRTKREMYEHLHAGHFGNTSPAFDDFEEASCYQIRRWMDAPAGTDCVNYCLMAIRSKNPGGKFYPNLRFGQFIVRYQALLREGVRADDLQFSEMLDHNGPLLRAYMTNLESGWVLDYSLDPNGNMRDVMQRAVHAEGLRALLIVKHLADPADFDDLMELFDRYPTAVIEFSLYRRACGTLNRRMIIWEVRSTY